MLTVQPQVYFKMTKEGILRYVRAVHLAVASFSHDKNGNEHNNGRPSIPYGYTSNFTDRKWFSQGLFTWREGAKASRLTHAMSKGNFQIILFKTRRFFMPDKYILKVKIHPSRSSGFHGICRIKVMLAAFLATRFCFIFDGVSNQTPLYFTTASVKRIEAI